MRNYYIFIGVLTVFVLSILIAGFTMVTNPFLIKDKKMDEKRAADINQIKYSISSYYMSNQKLPDEIPQPSGTYYSIKDPETKQTYEYNKINDIDYELCAVFDTDTTVKADQSQSTTSNLRATGVALPSIGTLPADDISKHPVGHYCVKYKACDYNCPVPTPSYMPVYYPMQTDPVYSQPVPETRQITEYTTPTPTVPPPPPPVVKN